jgi:hypothetical protein
VDFKQAKPSKDGKYQDAYIATYRDTESAAEIEDWIRYDGSKKDYYAGLRVERLHAIFGADLVQGENIDIKALLELSEGILFAVEVEQNGQYSNVIDVRSNNVSDDVV